MVESGYSSRPGSVRRRLPGLVPRSVAGQVLLLQVVVALVLIAATVLLLVVQSRHQAVDEARDRSLGVATAFRDAPGTVDAMRSEDPSRVLQPSSEKIRKDARVGYVVTFDPKGIRWSHPDPSRIGGHVTGSFEPALSGKPFQETFDSALGRAVDTTVAVFDEERKVVGLISVGIYVKSVNDQVAHQSAALFGIAGGALLLAAAGSAVVSRRLRRQTRGLAPAEMTRMYEHHDAVLHSVREGVLIIDDRGVLTLANDEGHRLLNLPPDAEQRPVSELGLAPEITELLVSGRSSSDEVHASGDRLLAVNLRTVERRGVPTGSVATLRDTTELRELAGRAETARSRLQLLYDAGTRIGTTLDVKRTAEELAGVAVPQFAEFVTVELFEPVLRGEEPPGGSTEMRRAAATGVRADHPLSPVGELLHFPPTSPSARGVAEGRAVLAADLSASGSWRAQDPERTRRVLHYGIHSLISAPLQARGVVLGSVDFWRKDMEPFDAEDLSFAEELAARAGVAIDNARRYTQEHATAVTLQRSLLPRVLPEHSALEVAHRYLPAQPGVGGDWYDVIPLPGARVALVVGDVVGHGLHAAATMGRLRTAVHNFSALDLSPDELLAHLDDLVTRLDEESGTGVGVSGATCLYAVYDPVGGRCTLARAGHPGPALVLPDGSVSYPEVPVAPPLGVSEGLPMETTELDLPEGSSLVLFTDGLIERRDRDLGEGLDLLRRTLAHPGRAPHDICRAVLDAMLGERPTDDVALLVARTHLLDPRRVASREVPDDPNAVSGIRAEAARVLESWGLGAIAFTTELIVSELVTNAIRYGAPPIRFRLLHHEDTLICEVADASSTAPHLRRAATTDEGGRGLFIIARIAQRWGTRYTPRGKVIWAEQSLRTPPPEEEMDGEALLEQWSDEGW
ncbi:SpoIIE family protein phosphatase [Streptomyces sp. NA04227]|uniref:SpoIIE family protein phosphatase/ATP-binding protein n=1 Tax=Streptomyces sp. NA04227 TaxID=2742136 RepID=UPI0015924155|nr:SpoIIE family protein phosphatase/ATP-binding protein [Streptomyces sp. NA04227]QKW10290.1 SpoIIE family protein phosphatase [Streptomyces sp. NA04227]